MFLPKIFDLGNAFKQYFEIVPAYSEALKDEVYRVRHQVYCEDLKFEPMRLDGREIDEYDACSLHLLIRNVSTHEFIGCTRIVRTDPENHQHSLPFEIACTNALDLSIVDPAKLPRQSIAEVSRLAVISRYRRRKGEATKTVGISDEDFGTPDLPRFPYIPIGLYIGTIELARLNGIDTLFVLTEERQAAHFGKLGVKIQTIGSPVEHHGKRIPSMMSISGIINNMRRMFRSLYRTIAADVEDGTP
ncbi:N-acyl amino acid synthase of PEP-CTERM/exosortase system [Nitrosospira sp. Nsp5]|uniref:N-acyl amino acid synthase, PEP-CTERM/exosortase system-associated n=1 Tax=Nitrosospira multiformis TaxID=1231 RepID=A0ABY0T8E8_9PROT|nr:MULTISPECIES: PEP-CTERM/exosortase system-associated acyltransferase [Nitrosospira]PTR07359.1 N-acyl amino acid synthase of PEP-CTERM/exosortase system [Nitrosospira sp. Nsp5]SDQ43112.1 N-acyl amino acid synthase, PEP-CTERM/exosortase system-associated [Nitrosospira multiformis]